MVLFLEPLSEGPSDYTVPKKTEIDPPEGAAPGCQPRACLHAHVLAGDLGLQLLRVGAQSGEGQRAGAGGRSGWMPASTLKVFLPPAV